METFKTSTALLCTVTAATLGFYYFYYYYSYWNQEKEKYNKPWKSIPGWLPIIGHAHLIPYTKLLYRKLEEWSLKYGQQHGCFEFQIVSMKFLVICRGDRLEEVLKYRPSHVHKPPKMRESVNSTGATGLFTAEGDEWKQERKLIAAAFNRRNVQDYLAYMKIVVHRLLQKWEHESDGGGKTILIDKDINRLTADAISIVGLGRDFDFVNNPDDPTVADMTMIMSKLLPRALAPVRYWQLPIIGPYLNFTGGAITRFRKVVSDTIAQQEESIARPEEDTNDTPKHTFLRKLLTIMESDKTSHRLTRQRMTGNAQTLFIAGQDTTARMMVHSIYILATDSKLRCQLRQEVDAVFPTSATVEKATVDQLYTNLPRMKSFLHEVHRHYGAPFTFMYIDKEIPFFNGTTTLKKGTSILNAVNYLSTHSPNIPLGPNETQRDKFDAERYLQRDEITGTLKPTPDPNTAGGAFGGFGYGKRVCPGRTYTEAFTYVFLVKLLQWFDFQDVNPEPATIVQNVLLVPDRETVLKLSKR